MLTDDNAEVPNMSIPLSAQIQPVVAEETKGKPNWSLNANFIKIIDADNADEDKKEEKEENDNEGDVKMDPEDKEKSDDKEECKIWYFLNILIYIDHYFI